MTNSVDEQRKYPEILKIIMVPEDPHSIFPEELRIWDSRAGSFQPTDSILFYIKYPNKNKEARVATPSDLRLEVLR